MMYEAIVREGVMRERARLQAIDDLCIHGHTALVAKAKYDVGMSAEALALAVLRAERSARAAAASDYADDATKVAGVPASFVAPGAVGSSDEKSLIEAMAKGMAATGRHKLTVVK